MVTQYAVSRCVDNADKEEIKTNQAESLAKLDADRQANTKA
jgi:hypothetical protein